MRSRPHKYLAALALLPLAAGCVQATRHSNTMVFGTTTSIALKVGQGANQVPQVLFGYDRQEAVVMPLLANTRERGGTEGLLSPCEPVLEQETVREANGVAVAERRLKPQNSNAPYIHPCKFVGVRSDGDKHEIQDSYSVLASFGAQIEGDGRVGKAAVGLAQYFATGVAAQLLAANGGAAVVAVGAGAEASAEATATGNASAAVFGEERISYNAGPNQSRLEAYLERAPDEADFARRNGLLLQSLKAANLGTSYPELFVLVTSGPESDRGKLILELMKLETNEEELLHLIN